MYLSYEDMSNLLCYSAIHKLIGWDIQSKKTVAEKNTVYYTSPALTKIKINMKLYPARLILISKNFPFTLKVLENNFNILTQYALIYFNTLIYNIIFI
jgi:hypothetical protein